MKEEAGPDRSRARDAAPHHRAAPVDRRLIGVHLRPDRGVDAVGPDQQGALHLRPRTVAVLDERAHCAVRCRSIAGDTAAKFHRLASDPLHELGMEQHMKLAAVNGILRPAIARGQPARLRIDVVAIEADQRPFPGGQADPVELIR
jgi:hypothetical protein